jgi:hypothetical protein
MTLLLVAEVQLNFFPICVNLAQHFEFLIVCVGMGSNMDEKFKKFVNLYNLN